MFVILSNFQSGMSEAGNPMRQLVLAPKSRNYRDVIGRSDKATSVLAWTSLLQTPH